MIIVIAWVCDNFIGLACIDSQFNRRIDERFKRRLRLDRDRSEFDMIDEHRLEIDQGQIVVRELHRFERDELLWCMLARPIERRHIEHRQFRDAVQGVVRE